MSVESTLREAIRDHSPVSLCYATTGSTPRTVHPHVLFRAAGGEFEAAPDFNRAADKYSAGLIASV